MAQSRRSFIGQLHSSWEKIPTLPQDILVSCPQIPSLPRRLLSPTKPESFLLPLPNRLCGLLDLARLVPLDPDGVGPLKRLAFHLYTSLQSTSSTYGLRRRLGRSNWRNHALQHLDASLLPGLAKTDGGVLEERRVSNERVQRVAVHVVVKLVCGDVRTAGAGEERLKTHQLLLIATLVGHDDCWVVVTVGSMSAKFKDRLMGMPLVCYLCH